MACLSNGTDDAPAAAAAAAAAGNTQQSSKRRPETSTAENAKRWKGKARGAPCWPSQKTMTGPHLGMSENGVYPQ